MSDYFIEREKASDKKIRQLLRVLPDFCSEYFLSIALSTSVLTRLNYANDLKLFFDYLIKTTEGFDRYDYIREITINDIENLKISSVELFLSYLTFYEYEGKQYHNSLRGKARKLSSIRSLLKYLFISEKITKNIGQMIIMPKISDKEIVKLDNEEMYCLLDNVNSGDNLSVNQQKYHTKLRIRDNAIISLFLGTGIRVSELVGLNNDDINFNDSSFVITRKGGDRAILFFSSELKEILQEYYDYKNCTYKPEKIIDKNAFFLSSNMKRLSVRAVQILVKKYAKGTTPLKKITPHKLRSTYGTNLYRETKDIYIVADVLGHSDVNTTKKHYAAISEDIRKDAADKVKLHRTNNDN